MNRGQSLTTMDAATAPPSHDGRRAADSAQDTELVTRWQQLEQLLDRAGDRLNPILVKEARQAMKSRQFIVTFSLLLIFGWLWTVLFISFGVPAIFYAPVGPGVLAGYYIVLSVPLLIVVPYAAFRSLAGEREDGTFELLSITTLTAHQIVLGKLGSAVLQMLVYYSALAPCIAFTYLLRGIDIVTIALFLAYTFLGSLLLSVFGLMMATVTKARHWQVLLSVVFVMALLAVAFVWDLIFFSILASSETVPLDLPAFWIANLFVLSFYLAAAAILMQIAAGQITFASENRSTPIRRLLLVPQLLLVGWMIALWLGTKQDEMLYMFACLAGLYWMVAGALLTGETALLSPRARRQLPQSLLGRMLLTWFNPGSGSGYIFATLNLLALMTTAWLAVLFAWLLGYERLPDFPEWTCFTVAITGYVMGYLGCARLAVVALRRVTQVGLLATFLFQVVFASAGILFPLLFQAVVSWGDYRSFDYSLLQISNWCWTLIEIEANRSGNSIELALLVGSGGLLVFGLNLAVAAHEIEQIRAVPPPRVQDDDSARNPVPRRKRNPWDDEPVAGSV
jgi:hypothetical protein